MRVAIDLLIVEKEMGGMFFATRALLEGLARVDHTNEYIIITARPQEYRDLAAKAPNIRIHSLKLRSWRGIMIRHQLLLPDALRKLQPDVLHVPGSAAPIGWHGPLVLTVHDLAFLKVPDQSSLYARLYWQYLLRESSRRAQRIIAISEQTYGELISYWSIEEERIRLIHNALRPSLCFAEISAQEIQEVRQRYGQRYLLHPGRIMPRKNVEKLVEAFELLAPRFDDLHLALTGGVGYGSKEVLEHIAASAYSDRIHLLGRLSDRELATLYRGASALVFPSRHEGFGLPIVEAMASGTPVVASPEAASREIAGEAAYRADCSNAATLADALAHVLSGEELRQRMIQLGYIQAQPFTIEKCAEATIRVYQEALGMEQPPAPLTAADGPSAESEGHPTVSVIVPNISVVGARIRGTSRSFFARCVDFTNFGYYQYRSPKDGPVASASMGVWRSVFALAGGFDATLSSSEDIDFCFRVQKQGLPDDLPARNRYRSRSPARHSEQTATL